MSAWSAHRRIAGGLIAALALTLAPAVTTSASAAAAPPPPTALRIDLSTPPVVGQISVTWNASFDADAGLYFVEYYYDDEAYDYDYTNGTTFVIPNVEPGESIDIRVRSLRSEQLSTPAELRVTGLDDNAPAYSFTDTTTNTFRYEISWLSSAGITTGYAGPGGSRFFAPSQPVLREQMAAFLYRLAGSPPVELPSSSPFTDVPTTATFYKQIVWLADRGISTGYTEPNGTKTFRPSQPVLREQMAAFLLRFDGTLIIAEGQTFTDVPTSATFYVAIEWLAGTGVSTGYAGPNGTRTFMPSQPVLREQMAAFLYRYQTGRFGQNIGGDDD